MPPKCANTVQKNVYKDMGDSKLSISKEGIKNDNFINRRKTGRVDGTKGLNEPTRQNHPRSNLFISVAPLPGPRRMLVFATMGWQCLAQQRKTRRCHKASTHCNTVSTAPI